MSDSSAAVAQRPRLGARASSLAWPLLLGLGGALLFALAWRLYEGQAWNLAPSPLEWALWIAATLAASIRPSGDTTDLTPSVSMTPILALGFLAGPVPAMILAVVATFDQHELRGRVSWRRVWNRHAVTAVAAGAAAIAFHALGAALYDGLSLEAAPLAGLLPAALAGAVYVALTVGLSALSRVSETGQRLAMATRSEIRRNGLASLGLVPLAWLLALSYSALGPLALLLIAIPLHTIRRAYSASVEVRRAFEEAIHALASAIDARDPSTRRHSARVAEIAVEIGREMGFDDDDLDLLRWGGLFHDIGKIGIRDSILLKPAALDQAERTEMNSHPNKGGDILANADRLARVVPLVRHHHEWYNGSGYPARLVGEDIPLLARILSVADSFEAMTAIRPYQPRPRPGPDAIEELRRWAGIQFDPEVVEYFIRTPTGRAASEGVIRP